MTASEVRRPSTVGLSVGLFFVIAIGGLFYVKWAPYYAKSYFAAAHHTLGASIVSGEAAISSPVGWESGFAYSLAYLKSIWPALVLGLALGAGVKVLLPRRLLARVFGGATASVRSTALAIPSMMCTCCAAPVAVGLMEDRKSVV